MNGSGIGYITDIGLNYFVRVISGLTTDTISQIAFGVGNTDDASSVSLETEYDRDIVITDTWDVPNNGNIYTSTHTIAAGEDAQVFYEMGAFTPGNIMPFVYASAISIGGGSPGDTTTCNFTLAFKDSSE
jgi:hypothetical protein